MGPRAFLPLFAASLLGLGACSQHAIRLRGTEDARPVRVILPLPLPRVAEDLESYLRLRRRVESKQLLLASGGFRFTQPWVRDSSLRYYLIDWDRRYRHVSDWKAAWILQPLDARRTQVELRVLETVFIGTPWTLRPRPLPEVVGGAPGGEWFEAEPDHFRAAFELRRFWTSAYPLLGLPPALAGVKAPDLMDPPLSRELLRPRWQPLERRHSF